MSAPATLHRTLSLPWIVLYGLGTTIGAGIYALTGEVAGIAGMNAPLAFLVATVGSHQDATRELADARHGFAEHRADEPTGQRPYPRRYRQRGGARLGLHCVARGDVNDLVTEHAR